ncbi:MAG: LacI family DNA-binding transcriptional regulator [Turicibacter sp.]
MTNIYKIAELTGFSPTTVSKVINNYPDVSAKTRKLIQDALKEHNFLPNSIAQSLSTKRTWTFGVFYAQGDQIGFNHPFFGNVLQAFRTRAEELGFSLLFACKNDKMSGNSVVEHLIQKRVDGILLMSTCGIDDDVQQLIDSNIPIVAIDVNDPSLTSIYSDSEQGVELAVNYLYGLGHRQIGYVTGGYHGENWISDIRCAKFIEVCQSLGLYIPEGYIHNGINFEPESGMLAVERFLTLDELPTAICCSSDFQAIGVMKALQKVGIKVPEEVSVIGFDDIPFVEFLHPPLTTIRQDTMSMGTICADLLGEQAASKKKLIERKVVPVSVRERESCTSPRVSTLKVTV